MWLEMLGKFKKESKKTTKEISAQSGVPIGTLNKLFAGQTSDPNFSTIAAVCHALGHCVDDLLIDIEPAQTIKSVSSVSNKALQIAGAYDRADERDRHIVDTTLEPYMEARGGSAEESPDAEALELARQILEDKRAEEESSASRGDAGKRKEA